MGLKSFFSELKRRNIYKVAAAYAITGWIIIQIATSVFPALEFPQWTTQFVIIITLIGFPIALVFAWAFEITPEGLKRTQEVPIEESMTHHTGKKLNYWIIGLLSVALILVLAERIWFAGTYSDVSTPTSTGETASVAVLPFDDFSPESDQQWFSDGLTEEILNSLARLPELRVASRTSSFLFREQEVPIQKIADSLNVNHVVEGSVRRIDDDMRVTAQLIRADDGSHLWSSTYDRHVDSVFKVQEDIAEHIATTLNVYLDPEKKERMFSFGTRNVKAYEAFLKGRAIYYAGHEIDFNLDTLWTANEWFENAIQADPEFAAPHFYHHEAYAHYLLTDSPTPEDTLKAERAYNTIHNDFESAIRLTDNPGEKMFYQLEKTFFSNNWDRMKSLIRKLSDNSLFRQAFIRLNAGWSSHYMIIAGYANLLHKLNKMIIQRNPLNHTEKFFNAVTLMAMGKTDSSRAKFNALRDKTDQELKHFIFYTHLLEGNYDKARSLISEDSSINNPIFALLPGRNKINAKKLNYSANSPTKIQQILHYFVTGNMDKVNKTAHVVDKSILGPQKLMIDISIFGGVILFDLESTPNFANRLEEADVEVKPFEFAGQKVSRIVQNSR